MSVPPEHEKSLLSIKNKLNGQMLLGPKQTFIGTNIKDRFGKDIPKTKVPDILFGYKLSWAQSHASR